MLCDCGTDSVSDRHVKTEWRSTGKYLSSISNESKYNHWHFENKTTKILIFENILLKVLWNAILTICHNASHWLKCSDTPIILQLYEEIFNVIIRIILCLYDLIIIDRFTHFRIRQNFTNFAFDVPYYQNLLYFDFNFHCTLFDEKTVNIKTKYHFAFFVFHVTGKHW